MKKIVCALLLACCIGSASAVDSQSNKTRSTVKKVALAVEKAQPGLLKKIAQALKNHPYLTGNIVGLSVPMILAAIMCANGNTEKVFANDFLLFAILAYTSLTPHATLLASHLPVEDEEEAAIKELAIKLSAINSKNTEELSEIKALIEQLQVQQLATTNSDVAVAPIEVAPAA
ncbi:MAG: hypothetical protein WCT20_02380 [Candidatus Babeliales bacterium]|jgi:hypothetical protein